MTTITCFSNFFRNLKLIPRSMHTACLLNHQSSPEKKSISYSLSPLTANTLLSKSADSGCTGFTAISRVTTIFSVQFWCSRKSSLLSQFTSDISRVIYIVLIVSEGSAHRPSIVAESTKGGLLIETQLSRAYACHVAPRALRTRLTAPRTAE